LMGRESAAGCHFMPNCRVISPFLTMPFSLPLFRSPFLKNEQADWGSREEKGKKKTRWKSFRRVKSEGRKRIKRRYLGKKKRYGCDVKRNKEGTEEERTVQENTAGEGNWEEKKGGVQTRRDMNGGIKEEMRKKKERKSRPKLEYK